MASVLSVSKHGDRFVTWGPEGPAKLDFLELQAFFGPFIFTHSNMGLPSGWFSLAKEQHPQMSFSHRMGESRLPCLITRGSRSNYVEIAMAMHGLRLLKMTCPPVASYGNGNPLGAYGNINLWPLWPLGTWFDPKHQIQPKLSKLSVWPISKWWQTWEISLPRLEIWGHDIIDLVQHLQLQRVGLLGHSLGGMIVPWRFNSASAEQHAMVSCEDVNDGWWTSIYFPTYGYGSKLGTPIIGWWILN